MHASDFDDDLAGESCGGYFVLYSNIYDAFNKLDPFDVECWRLKTQGFSQRDISKMLGTSQASVHRGISRIAKVSPQYFDQSWQRVLVREVNRYGYRAPALREPLERSVEWARMHLEECGYETSMPPHISPRIAVKCPDGRNWELTKRSVVRLAVNGKIHCYRNGTRHTLVCPKFSDMWGNVNWR